MADDNIPLASGEQSKGQPRRGVIGGTTFQFKMVTYSPVDGDAIFEGDIILGSVADLDAALATVSNAVDVTAAIEGIAIPGSQHRWPDGKVPFRINSNLNNPERVTQAIEHWEQQTPIRFHDRTTEVDFVEFRLSGNCSSSIGRQGGIQFVNLGPQCTRGNVIHELGHTLGLWHEQSREDRDNFITIDFSNVDPLAIHNFDQHITDGDDVGAYDFGSIMHYPAIAFPLDPSKPTIITKNGEAIGQRIALSAGDIAAIKEIYGF